MKAGKLVPSSQCRNVERGTGKNSSAMSKVAAHAKAPDILHEHVAQDSPLKQEIVKAQASLRFQNAPEHNPVVKLGDTLACFMLIMRAPKLVSLALEAVA